MNLFSRHWLRAIGTALLSGCAGSATAAQDVPSSLDADHAPMEAGGTLDAMGDASTEGRYTCDRPRRSEVGVLGTACYLGSNGSAESRERGWTICYEREFCCTGHGRFGTCDPATSPLCSREFGYSFILCDGPEDCPAGTVCCENGTACSAPEACGASLIFCHDDADCPCDAPRCCGRVRTDFFTPVGARWTCSATCT